MAVEQNTIAMVFDFDDTLTDDSITALLDKKGVDVETFWTKDVASLVKDGWDPPLAYMRRTLELTAPGKPVQGLTSEELREFGRTLKPYPGLLRFFDDLGKLVQSQPEYRKAKIKIEFYIISGGLEEIINNTPFRKFFKDAWGSAFHSDPQTDLIEFPRNAVTFTDKTRFLFQINKGVWDVRREKIPTK